MRQQVKNSQLLGLANLSIVSLLVLNACSEPLPSANSQERNTRGSNSASTESANANAASSDVAKASTDGSVSTTNSDANSATPSEGSAATSTASSAADAVTKTNQSATESGASTSTLKKYPPPTKVIIRGDMGFNSIYVSADQERAYCLNSQQASNGLLMQVSTFDADTLKCSGQVYSIPYAAGVTNNDKKQTGWDPIGERLAIAIGGGLWVIDVKSKSSKAYAFPSGVYPYIYHYRVLNWSGDVIASVGNSDSEYRYQSAGNNMKIWSLNTQNSRWRVTDAPASTLFSEGIDRFFVFDQKILIIGNGNYKFHVSDVNLSGFKTYDLPLALQGGLTPLTTVINGKVKFFTSGRWQTANLITTYDVASSTWSSSVPSPDMIGGLAFAPTRYYAFGLNSTFFAGAMYYDSDADKMLSLPIDGAWRLVSYEWHIFRNAFWFKGRGYLDVRSVQLNAAGPNQDVTMVFTP